MEIEIPIMTKEDYNLLSTAKSTMENVGIIMHGLNNVGGVIEKGVDLIPEKQQKWIGTKVNSVLMSVVSANLKTMSKEKTDVKPLNKTYKAVVFASGTGLGFFGAFGFGADLMVSTKFMIRSIMDIARSKGENVNEIETQLACIEVLALGGKSKNDDGINTSYYATRMALKASIKEASAYVAKNGSAEIIEKLLLSSAFIRFISQIASRFGVQVTEKFVAEAIPVVGAVGGGAINLIFIHHFQNMAGAHFTVRSLERKYGAEFIQEKYNEIKVN